MKTPPSTSPNSSERESLAAALQPTLAKLTAVGLSRSKQEGVIVAIAGRYAIGQGYDTPEFWKRSDTCARSTFNKWRKHDPYFVVALEAAKQVVSDWRVERAADVVEEAVIRLQMATPDFVDRIIQIAKGGENEYAQLQAAFGGLDRASKLTAPKTQLVDALMQYVDLSQLSDDQLDRLMAGENPIAVILGKGM